MVRHRRPLVAVLVATAVVLGLSALRPAAPDTTDVVVAAHDLSAGALLDQTDVQGLMALDAAKDDLGWRPRVGFADGLAAYVDWLQENPF